MKRFLLLWATVGLLAVGCQTDNTTENSVAIGNNNGTTLTVSLAQTRTSLGGKEGDIYPVYWSEGDKIVVNGNLSEEVKIDTDNRANATFSVTAGFSYPCNITYPYCEATSAEQAVVEFLAEQTYTENTFAQGSLPMCGYVASKSNSVTLSHIASVLRLPVKAKFGGAVLEKIVVTSTEKISGEFEVDCKNATISTTESCGNSVVYTLPSNFTLSTSAESVFHIVLPAISVGSSTIEFIETSGESMVATWTPSKPLSKGVVREFKTITYEPKVKTSLQPLTIEEDEFTILYDHIYGYVKYSDGSPIANVAVSDGFQVVTTDKNGYYELNDVPSDTWYIFCSLPNDVEVPINEYGQPCFFQKYPTSSPQYDFTFKKLANGPEEEFIIFALADTQPSNTQIIERFAVQAAPEIKSYSKSLGLPCYGVVLGDVVGDHPELMPSMRAELAYDKTGMPIFTVMGNHDHSNFNKSRPLFPDERNRSIHIKAQRAYEDCFGPANYSYNRGNVHIVGMRDVYNRSNVSVSDYTTGFSKEQYDWLLQDLALVSKEKMVVLCVHIPIFNGGTIGDGTHRQEVLTLLNQFEEAHILSGHTHYMHPYSHAWNKTSFTKIYEHCIASTRPDMYDSNIHRDGTPLGYAILKAKGNSFVDWYYKSYVYGMDSRDDQIRLYRGATVIGKEPAESETNSHGTKGYYQLPFDNSTLLANIFSSDPSWTVEVREDGGAWNKMTYFYNLKGSDYTSLVGSGTSNDPWRVTDGLVCSRDFWAIGILYGYLGSSVGNNYNTCYTMWRYTLQNPDAKKIEVRATDPHSGYVYTEDKVEDGIDFGYAFYDPQYNPVIE